jgi:hypothetical protein
MPAVTPMLAVSGDACGDLNFRLHEEGVELDLSGKREEAWPPNGGHGLRTDQGFENEVKAMREDPAGPTTPELP